jgi:hypothetical protein
MTDQKRIFSDIYAKGLWNDNRSDIPASGPGSLPANSETFRSTLDSFCKTHAIQTIVDIGCGDLTWMPMTDSFKTCKYTGIDIVPDLIKSHTIKYPHHTFLNRNAIEEEVPQGDLVIVRDVLFHLVHEDIKKLLENIKGKFKYYFLTSCKNNINDDTLNQYHFHEVNLAIAPFYITKFINTIEEPEFNRHILLLDSNAF